MCNLSQKINLPHIHALIKSRPGIDLPRNCAPLSLSRGIGFPRIRPTALSPQGLGSPPPPNSLPRLRETPYANVIYSLPCSISGRLLSITQKGRVSQNTSEEANTPSRTRPETQASPTRASTKVTGTLHTRFSVNISECRTLPDVTHLPPGLYWQAEEACRTITLKVYSNHSDVF